MRVTSVMHREIHREALRQDRSKGDMLRQAWAIARTEIATRPTETTPVKPLAAEETDP